MLRALAAVLMPPCLSLACLSLAPPGAAEPMGSCPPACNRIPDTAWIPASSIPLHARYGWPQLAGLAVTARPLRFRFEELCSTPPAAADPRSYAIAERSVVSAFDGQWHLQAQILHWRGDTWWGGTLAKDAVTAAASALRSCQLTNPAASPSITLDEPGRFAAVVSGPVILHEYLLADPSTSTVTELALWSSARAQTPDPIPYPILSDSAVLDALGAPLCEAYLGSCA